MSKFKVGDRVRFISANNTQSDYGYNNNMLEINDIATIEKIIDENRIRIEEGSYTYHPDDFELVDEWLTPGEALDAHLEGKELIDDDDYVWKPKEYISTLVFKDNKFRIKPEPDPLLWEPKQFAVSTLDESMTAYESYLEVGCQEIDRKDALKIADFIVETYRKEDNNPVWQSAETAPKDGTRILAYFKGLGQAIVFHRGEGDYPWETSWDRDRIGDRYLLYWMPLPKLPEGENKMTEKEKFIDTGYQEGDLIRVGGTGLFIITKIDYKSDKITIRGPLNAGRLTSIKEIKKDYRFFTLACSPLKFTSKSTS